MSNPLDDRRKGLEEEYFHRKIARWFRNLWNQME
jgi:hypothetical protein